MSADIRCSDTEGNAAEADNTVAAEAGIDDVAVVAVFVADDDEIAVVGTAVGADVDVERTDTDTAAAAAAVGAADAAVDDDFGAAVVAAAADAAAAPAVAAVHLSEGLRHAVAEIQKRYLLQEHHAIHDPCRQQMSAVAAAAVATRRMSKMLPTLQWEKMTQIGESLENEEMLLRCQEMLGVETGTCSYFHRFRHSWVKTAGPQEGRC